MEGMFKEESYKNQNSTNASYSPSRSGFQRSLQFHDISINYYGIKGLDIVGVASFIGI